MTGIEQNGPGVVAFAGGSGGAAVGAPIARELPHLVPDVHTTLVAPAGDSGGATEYIRRMVGGPAPGDARKMLGGLASNGAAELFRDHDDKQQPLGRFGADATLDTVRGLNGRFEDIIAAEGHDNSGLAALMFADTVALARDVPYGLPGQSYMNLALTALRLRTGSLTSALQVMGGWVGVPPNVDILPVTEESYNLVLHDRVTGTVRVGEGLIDEYTPRDINEVDVWLAAGPMQNQLIEDPHAVAAYLEQRADARSPQATSQVLGRLAAARAVLSLPSSLLTSHAQMKLVGGVGEALQEQRAAGGAWVVVANLTEEKPGMRIGPHVRLLQDATGARVTHLMHNTDTDGIPEGSIPLHYDPETDGLSAADIQAIPGALVDHHIVPKSNNDRVAHLRSSVHHDGLRVVELLASEVLPGVLLQQAA